MKRLTPTAARLALRIGGEVALLDVREHGQYGEGHPLFAVNSPYSRLEMDAPRLLPCKSSLVVLVDDDDGVAQRAARRLDALGYCDVAVMEGGAPAWAAAGLTLFKGVNVPSKVFGELLEHARNTPTLDPLELKSWLDRNEPFVLLDGRTPAEYSKMTLPGALSCPNAELGYRLPALIKSAQTPVVIHCAGRTRSILGAESLRALGVPNPVYALRNGTQGWQLAGFDLQTGSRSQIPDIDEQTREASGENAVAFRARNNVPVVGPMKLDEWRKDAGRTLYVFDVRTEQEYRAGHIPHAVHAPGGQLVQATDHWIAVRGARVVLIDDTGLRASLTAYWLRQMGHSAFVLDEDVTGLTKSDKARESERAVIAELPSLSLSQVAGTVANGGILLDLNPSMTYRAGHVAGARWAIRPRLDEIENRLDSPFVLICADPRVAELAAIDLREMGIRKLTYASGEVEQWRAANLEIVATPELPDDSHSIDYLFFVHDRHLGNLDAARRYLEWEANLVNQIDDIDRSVFRVR